MSANIYVGNLTFNVGNDELRSLFVPYGEVSSANVITDRDSGRSRGFGFVEMASKEAADSAISALNGKDHGGRQLTVNIAQQRLMKFQISGQGQTDDHQRQKDDDPQANAIS